MQILLTVGSLLAGTSAAVGLTLGLTKTARLRRQEESLRKAVAALADDAAQRRAMADLHLDTVAAATARQVCGRWPFIWPWIVWLAAAGSAGQVGYFAAKYADDRPGKDTRGGVAFQVFGVGSNEEIVFFIVVSVLVLVMVFTTYRSRLVERAEVEREFRVTGRLRRPVGMFPNRGTPAPQPPAGSPTNIANATEGRRFARFMRWLFVDVLTPVVPGVAVLAFGTFVGVIIYAKVHHDGPLSESLSAVTAYSILALSASAVLALAVGGQVVFEIVDARSTPRAYPTETAPTYADGAGYL